MLLLEKPLDLNSVARVQASGFHILSGLTSAEIEAELRKADIVLINWSHHPAMTRFLAYFPAVSVRSMMWCHVSGNYFPYVEPKLLDKFDQVIFATPYSLQLPQIRSLGEKYIKEHFSVVYGLNDLKKFQNVSRATHETFNIGYVGTLGFCKLHPQFVEYCAAVDVPNVKFLMVGAPSTKEVLLKQADQFGIADRFQFWGQVSNVPRALEQMDLFSYLLNPQHFGATENALLEAMASGLPTIALDQCVEHHIIKNEITGLLVRSPKEYGEAVRRLYEQRNEATLMGERAQRTTLEYYAIERNRERFMAACRRAADCDKHILDFSEIFSGDPADWFLSAVNMNRECFEENRAYDAGLIFHEPTKGSPVHYSSYFPQDDRLAAWTRQLTEGGQF